MTLLTLKDFLDSNGWRSSSTKIVVRSNRNFEEFEPTYFNIDDIIINEKLKRIEIIYKDAPF